MAISLTGVMFTLVVGAAPVLPMLLPALPLLLIFAL